MLQVGIDLEAQGLSFLEPIVPLSVPVFRFSQRFFQTKAKELSTIGAKELGVVQGIKISAFPTIFHYNNHYSFKPST